MQSTFFLKEEGLTMATYIQFFGFYIDEICFISYYLSNTQHSFYTININLMKDFWKNTSLDFHEIKKGRDYT